MKKLQVFTVLSLILFCGCATHNYNLSKTVWYNLSPAEKDGEKGIVVTSLYFLSTDTVDIYNSVIVDTTVVIKPFKYAAGTYSTSGNPKKEAKISITANTLQKEILKYNGIYQKADVMFLVLQDSVQMPFIVYPNVKLP
jgi:hypothetical protein